MFIQSQLEEADCVEWGLVLDSCSSYMFCEVMNDLLYQADWWMKTLLSVLCEQFGKGPFLLQHDCSPLCKLTIIARHLVKHLWDEAGGDWQDLLAQDRFLTSQSFAKGGPTSTLMPMEWNKTFLLHLKVKLLLLLYYYTLFITSTLLWLSHSNSFATRASISISSFRNSKLLGCFFLS